MKKENKQKERFTEHTGSDNKSFRVIPSKSYYASIDKLGKFEDLEEKTGLSVEEAFELLNDMRKHCTNDGWSNGYTIKFWEMKTKELKLVEKWFKGE